RWRDDTAGQYAGVGIRIEADPKGLKIIGVYSGGPASKAGLRPGEIVTDVDGISLAGADFRRGDTLRRLKGEPNTLVHVRVWTPPPAPAKTATPEKGATGAPPAPPVIASPAVPAAEPAPVAAPAAGSVREVDLTRRVIRPATI